MNIIEQIKAIPDNAEVKWNPERSIFTRDIDTVKLKALAELHERLLDYLKHYDAEEMGVYIMGTKEVIAQAEKISGR